MELAGARWFAPTCALHSVGLSWVFFLVRHGLLSGPHRHFFCEDPIADFWGGMVLHGGVEFLLARLDFSLNFVGKNTVAGCVDHVLGGREVLTTNGGKLDRTSNIPGKEW